MFAAMGGLALLLAGAGASQAANILNDPGLEATTVPGAETINVVGWTTYGQSWGNYHTETGPAGSPIAHSGTNYFKIFQGFTGSVNYNGMFQDNVSGPGAEYAADGWTYTSSTDTIGGGNQAWIEVTFRDSTGNNILALYRSAVLDSTMTTDTWIDLPITNQYDTTTYTVTNTVTSLVAPAGTAIVRYQIVFQGDAANSGGSLFFDDLNLDQTGGALPPVISGISLNNDVALFNNTNTLHFTATSPNSAINNSGVHLTLNGVDVTAQLVIGGTASVKDVSYPGLLADRAYVGTISVMDVNGFTVTSPVRFDTFNPTNFVWEAEDFDYGSGLFIDNSVPATSPGSNTYFGLVATQDVDEHEIGFNGPQNYRNGDPMATDLSNDTARPQFAAASAPDYSIGYFDSGEWVNYTRTYPAGNYTVYARLANGNNGTANTYLGRVTSGQGTTTQTVAPLGQFRFTGRGWNAYDFVPLTDAWGNIVTVSLGGVETLRLTSGPLGGGVNANFLMLAPARTDLPPAITDIYPDGAQPFQGTNRFAFNVTSASSTVSAGNIHVVLDGADVSSQLVLAGNATSWNVSLPIAQGIHSVAVTATDAASRTTSFNATFDNFSQSNFMIELEDFDFGGGLFIDNPIPTAVQDPNSYFFEQYADAIFGIDLTTPANDAGEQFAYRPFESCGTEVTSDFLRNKYVQAQVSDPAVRDYDVGWWNGGTWLNFTRTFPTNTYNVYARLAGGGGGAYSLALSVLTGGWGTTEQTTNNLGTFSATGIDWQVWQWVPMLGTNGQLAVITLGGTNTIKATSGGGLNANFLMFVPAAAPSATPVAVTASISGGNIHLAFPTQSGHSYTVLYQSALGAGSWNTLTVVSGDGTVKTVNDPVGPGNRFYKLQIQ